MSNYAHIMILKDGIAAWNEWRAKDPDTIPNLSESNLIQSNLTQANLRQADLKKADLRNAVLARADLRKADLRNANLRGAKLVEADLCGANLSGAVLIGADLSKTDLSTADLRKANLSGADLFHSNLSGADLNDAWLKKAHLLSANLKGANLKGADISGSVLVIANLANADLSLSDLTGTKLYGTARDDWKIYGVKCDYVYWDGAGKTRTPSSRDFKPGEFELRYRQLPTIEFLFTEGFSPLDFILLDQIVKTINQEMPELELSLDSMIVRGIPRAVFSVLHKEHCEKALSLVAAHYKSRRRALLNEEELLSSCYREMMRGADKKTEPLA